MMNELNNPDAMKQPYLFTIREAAAYYGIGENTLRRLVAQNPTAPFVCAVGNRNKIKRKQFEKFLDETSVI